MAKHSQSSKSPAEWILQLKNTHLFHNIADEQLVDIAQYTKLEHLEADQIVFHEGAPGEKIFFQLDGESVVFLGSDDKPTILTKGQPGDCFGEMAVIDKLPRSASLKTTTPTHFLTIDQANFEKILMGGHSRFSINLMHSLSQRLRQTDAQLIEMLQQENTKLEETLTLLKNTQNELLAKERLSTLGRMASMIVHDLRNPLTSISTMGYILTSEDLSEEQRENYGNILNSEIHRLVEMIEEILLFAKDQSSLQLTATDISVLFAKVKEEMEKSTQSWPIAWKLESSVGQSYSLDASRLHRAFLNLCKNSWEALKLAKSSSPMVKIEAYETEEGLIFLIQDNGPGIPEAIRETIFDAFVSNGKSHGTGLGLAIVKKVVDDHRGKIHHLSSPEKGTQFEIIIPKTIPLAR